MFDVCACGVLEVEFEGWEEKKPPLLDRLKNYAVSYTHLTLPTILLV